MDEETQHDKHSRGYLNEIARAKVNAISDYRNWSDVSVILYILFYELRGTNGHENSSNVVGRCILNYRSKEHSTVKLP